MSIALRERFVAGKGKWPRMQKPNQSLKHDAGRRLLSARAHPREARSVPLAAGRTRLCGSVDAVWATCGRTAQFS